MNSPNLRRLMQETQHPPDERLLAYADGELKPRTAGRVKKHLEACWACRARLGEFERVSAAVVRCQDSVLLKEENLPPGGWRAFHGRLVRLAAAQAELGKPRLAGRPRLALRLAGIAAVVALGAWLRFSSVPVVSAEEILKRAETAETEMIRETRTSIVRHRLRVLRTSASSAVTESAELEVWADPGGGRFVRRGPPHVWRELTEAFDASGMKGRRPFSVAAYLAWRASLSEPHDDVQLVHPKGTSAGFLLRTTELAPRASRPIVAADLVLRRADWRVVEQRLRVRTADGEFNYQVFERGFGAVVVNKLPPDVFASVAVPVALRRPIAPPVAPVGPDRTEADAGEVAARYALHQLHACLGEHLEVAPNASSGVLVHGIVDTVARRDEVAAALVSLPLVEVRIRTVEEALAELSQAGPPVETREPPVRTTVLPLEPALKRLFAQSASEGEVSLKIADLANGAVTASSTALTHAWALHRLNQAFPPARVQQLRGSSPRLLEQMMQDHLEGARQASVVLCDLIEPVWRAESLPAADEAPTPAVQLSDVERLLEQARGIDRLVRYLLTGSPQPGLDPETALAQLMGAVSRFQGDLTLVETEITAEWAKLTRRPSEREP